MNPSPSDRSTFSNRKTGRSAGYRWCRPAPMRAEKLSLSRTANPRSLPVPGKNPSNGSGVCAHKSKLHPSPVISTFNYAAVVSHHLIAKKKAATRQFLLSATTHPITAFRSQRHDCLSLPARIPSFHPGSCMTWASTSDPQNASTCFAKLCLTELKQEGLAPYSWADSNTTRFKDRDVGNAPGVYLPQQTSALPTGFHQAFSKFDRRSSIR